jgi:type I restriction enzyme M protein
LAVNLEFENKLWEMADKLRGNIQPSDYKAVILGLIFLKYISDSFEEKYLALLAEGDGFEEDRDAYIEDNIFFVPPSARWGFIKKSAKQSTIGQIIDEAMIAIEKENKNLKGVLPKNYARPELDKTKLGELIDLFSFNLGSKKSKAQDILGRVYEYFLGKFGSNEGEFYTPPTIVKLLVGMIEPFKGRVYEKKLKELYEEAITEIRKNPEIGRLEKGDLAGIRGYDIIYNRINYEIAYRLAENEQGEVVVVIMAGTRENFWDAVKKYIK